MPAEEIFYLPLSELAKRIETKKLSPVELTQIYLDRSTKFGPRFNAYARLNSGDCPRTSKRRGKRDSARPLSGTFAWNTVRGEGSLGRQGHSYYVGSETLCRSSVSVRCDRD